MLYKCQALIRVDSGPSLTAPLAPRRHGASNTDPRDESWHFLIPSKHSANSMSTKVFLGERDDRIEKDAAGQVSLPETRPGLCLQ